MQAPAAVAREAVVMGTPVTVEVAAADRATALGAAESALEALRHWDRVLTTWDPAGELAQLNADARPGPVPVRADLGRALAEAGRWVAATDGAFDPAVGALLDAWDLRGAGRVPDEAALAEARDRAGWGTVRVDSAAGWTVTRQVPGVVLDAGGFGKGTALRAALAEARAAGARTVRINLGGQLVQDAEGPVTVAHPRHRDRPVATLALGPGSVATSGQSERRRVVEGRVLGHVLDPRTGAPAPPWGSVTVVAADPVAADALSTALFVLGAEAALAWAAEHPDVGVLVIEDVPTPRLRWSAALDGRVTPAGPAHHTSLDED